MEGAQSELAQAPGPHGECWATQGLHEQTRGDDQPRIYIIELIHSRSF